MHRSSFRSLNRVVKTRGFTLVELIIVVAIAGILTAVAAGYYRDNVITSNRTEARAVLSATAASLEKCKSLYGAYNNASCAVAFPITTDGNLYTITQSAITNTTFTLLATPVAGEAQASDADCTTFSLTNTGLETATGASPAICWN